MSSKVLLGFLAGAAAGALAGILLAPDKGSETRKKIAGKASDLGDSVKSTFSEFIDGLKHGYRGAKEDVQEMSDELGNKMSAAKKDVRNTFS